LLEDIRGSREAVRSSIRTAEYFRVEEIIDPRDTSRCCATSALGCLIGAANPFEGSKELHHVQQSLPKHLTLFASLRVGNSLDACFIELHQVTPVVSPQKEDASLRVSNIVVNTRTYTQLNKYFLVAITLPSDKGKSSQHTSVQTSLKIDFFVFIS